MEISAAIKITIITVCKNSEKFLRETITSIINQNYHHIEYIVIDGNSTDETMEIIKENLPHISIWLSEEDSGMYDAINKGLKLASGDYILILNSDDVLAANDTIKNIVSEIKKERLDYYHGNMLKMKDKKLKKVKLFSATYKELLLSTHGTFVPHPCFFISSKLNQELAGYDLKFRYASDYDYILRALAFPGAKGKYIDRYITKFRLHENSITSSGKINEERIKILQKNGFYSLPYISRLCTYYKLWIFYKIINAAHFYKNC